jgi:hypothetical protein
MNGSNLIPRLLQKEFDGDGAASFDSSSKESVEAELLNGLEEGRVGRGSTSSRRSEALFSLLDSSES